MEGRIKSFFMFRNPLLLLALSAFLAQGVTADLRSLSSWTTGHANGAVPKKKEIVTSSQDDALNRLWSLKDGQRLHLEMGEVRLNATVTIAASNVAVYGSGQRTRVHCPRRRSAFLIRGQNVTLISLEISNCHNSALKIVGGHANRAKHRTTKRSTSQSRKKSQEEHEGNVRVVNCMFQRNTARAGAGILVDGSSLSIRGTTFVENVADVYGGALHSHGARIWIESSSFDGNEAKVGGAMCVEDAQSLEVTDSTFRTNSAVGTRGCVGISAFRCKTGGAVHIYNCQDGIIARSAFQGNVAGSHGGAIIGSDGGAIFINSCDKFAVKLSVFKGNTANRDGGVFAASYSPNITVEGSTFAHNTAKQDGGAVRVHHCTRVTTRNSDFDGNSAGSDGGAVAATGNTGLSLCDVMVRNNSGVLGGGVFLTASARLKADFLCRNLTFQANTAFRGGGLFCSECKHPLGCETGMRFEENVAAESGGGAFIADEFVGNIAAYGGGLALTDSAATILPHTYLADNLAIDGGGVHIKSSYGKTEEYDVKLAVLEGNQAHNLSRMYQTNKTAVSHWLKARERFLFEFKRDWLHPDEYSQGRGGGAFISLQKQREDSILNLRFWNIVVKSNTADVGGGMYIDNGVRKISHDKCVLRTGPTQEPYMYVDFQAMKFVENSAYTAGGGLFVPSPHSLAAYGISEKSLSPLKECDALSTDDYTVCYQGNHISCHDEACYGPAFATRARYLELQNVDRPIKGLRSGKRLVVLVDTSEGLVKPENIMVAVKDALRQIIKGKTADSELAVILLSNRTSGQLRYNAVNGIITITSTQVLGYAITSELTIQSDDERKINTSLTFSTLPCPDGEVPTKSKSECFRCPLESYAFESNATKCHS